jgi:hypothetical protein
VLDGLTEIAAFEGLTSLLEESRGVCGKLADRD